MGKIDAQHARGGSPSSEAATNPIQGKRKEGGREEGEGNSKYVTAARRGGGTQVTYFAERRARAGRVLKTNNVFRPRSAAAAISLNHV